MFFFFRFIAVCYNCIVLTVIQWNNMMRVINLGVCQDGRLPRLSAVHSSIYIPFTILLREYSSPLLADNVGRFSNIIRYINYCLMAFSYTTADVRLLINNKVTRRSQYYVYYDDRFVHLKLCFIQALSTW